MKTSQHDEEYLRACFAGEKLYGNDFNGEELAHWYADEAEAYANLGAKKREGYNYKYHLINQLNLFEHIPDQKYFDRALGFGSAYGEEFLPLIKRISNISILDPSGAFPRSNLEGVPLDYCKPNIDGRMDYKDSSFDLVVCCAALHHVANVSLVISEFGRILRGGGYALIREPIVSMGDWRKHRRGLTNRERGIPLPLMRRMIGEAGFIIQKETLAGFPPVRRLGAKVGTSVYRSVFLTRLDVALARAFAFNWRYHARGIWQHLRPTHCSFVTRKKRNYETCTRSPG